MEAIRYIKEIDSDTLTIKDLDKYKGQKVEIIILPFESPAYEFDKEAGEEAEARLKAFDAGLIDAVDGREMIKELKEKYSS